MNNPPKSTSSMLGGSFSRVTGLLAFAVMFATCSYVGRRNLLDCFTDSPPPGHCRGEPFGLALVPQPPALPPEFGLEEDDAVRIRAAMEREMMDLYSHPAFRARMQDVMRTTTSRSDTSLAVRALAQEVVHAGLKRLSHGELREWNRLRAQLAGSSPLCASMWRGTVQPTELFQALADLSDTDLRAWNRVSKIAGVLEVEERGATEVDDQVIGEVIELILAGLTESDRVVLEAGLDAPETVDDESACRSLRLMLEAADSLEPRLQERYLRALAAL